MLTERQAERLHRSGLHAGDWSLVTYRLRASRQPRAVGVLQGGAARGGCKGRPIPVVQRHGSHIRAVETRLGDLRTLYLADGVEVA